MVPEILVEAPPGYAEFAEAAMQGTMEQRRASVLVVEDDPGIRMLLRRALVEDYDVHLAGDGREALETFARVRPGIVTVGLGRPPKPRAGWGGIRRPG